jgi:hypothetical protein
MTAPAGGSLMRSAGLSRRQPPRRPAPPAPGRPDKGLYVSYALARLGLQGGKLLGVVGTLAGVGATSFYGTTYAYCYFSCLGQQ